MQSTHKEVGYILYFTLAVIIIAKIWLFYTTRNHKKGWGRLKNTQKWVGNRVGSPCGKGIYNEKTNVCNLNFCSYSSLLVGLFG